MINCLFVGIGGFIGSVLRYLISLVPLEETIMFPIKTFVTNIIGAFIIGLIAAFVLKYPDLDSKSILLLKTGFCGGFTTFSTFALESSDLLSKGNAGVSVVYMLLSVMLCVLAVFAAEYIAGKMF